MTGWSNDMSAAPRTSSVMLYGALAGEISGTFDRAYICIGEWSGRSDYPGYDWICANTDAYAVWCKPTHWQHLPTTPSTEGQGA